MRWGTAISALLLDSGGMIQAETGGKRRWAPGRNGPGRNHARAAAIGREDPIPVQTVRGGRSRGGASGEPPSKGGAVSQASEGASGRRLECAGWSTGPGPSTPILGDGPAGQGAALICSKIGPSASIRGGFSAARSMGFGVPVSVDVNERATRGRSRTWQPAPRVCSMGKAIKRVTRTSPVSSIPQTRR